MINFDPIFFCLDVVIFLGVIVCVLVLLHIRSDTKRGADSLREIEKVWCDEKPQPGWEERE